MVRCVVGCEAVVCGLDGVVCGESDLGGAAGAGETTAAVADAESAGTWEGG